MFEQLITAQNRGELILIDGGFCRYHLRGDGQLTIYEILSQKEGNGKRMLASLEKVPNVHSILAKCPADLPANQWYLKNGFIHDGIETTRSGRQLIVWRKPIMQRKMV